MPAIMDVKKAVETAGGEQTLEYKLRRFATDVRYMQSIRQELLRNYIEQWVAVYDGALVGNAENLERLLKQLSDKNIRHDEAVIEYLAKERKAMLL
jgi:hypothetical protein